MMSLTQLPALAPQNLGFLTVLLSAVSLASPWSSAAAEAAQEETSTASRAPTGQSDARVDQDFAAQSAALSERGRARALFADGLAFADRAAWEAAADRFHRALTLIETAEIRYNLASALAQLGRNLAATELLMQVEAQSTASLTVRQASKALRERLQSQLGRLHVQLQDLQQTGRELRLDGQPLHWTLVNVDMPVDAGMHQVELWQGPKRLALCTAQVGSGQRALCRLQVAAPHSPKAKETPQRQPLYKRWWFWTTVAVVAAAAATGAVLVRRQDGTPATANETGALQLRF